MTLKSKNVKTYFIRLSVKFNCCLHDLKSVRLFILIRGVKKELSNLNTVQSRKSGHLKSGNLQNPESQNDKFPKNSNIVLFLY